MICYLIQDGFLSVLSIVVKIMLYSNRNMRYLLYLTFFWINHSIFTKFYHHKVLQLHEIRLVAWIYCLIEKYKGNEIHHLFVSMISEILFTKFFPFHNFPDKKLTKFRRVLSRYFLIEDFDCFVDSWSGRVISLVKCSQNRSVVRPKNCGYIRVSAGKPSDRS